MRARYPRKVRRKSAVDSFAFPPRASRCDFPAFSPDDRPSYLQHTTWRTDAKRQQNERSARTSRKQKVRISRSMISLNLISKAAMSVRSGGYTAIAPYRLVRSVCREGCNAVGCRLAIGSIRVSLRGGNGRGGRWRAFTVELRRLRAVHRVMSRMPLSQRRLDNPFQYHILPMRIRAMRGHAVQTRISPREGMPYRCIELKTIMI